MTTYKSLFAGLALICACAAADTVSPFACNLKAFQPNERTEWRKRIEQVMSAVTSKRPLADGYSFQIDPRKASFRDVAEWVDQRHLRVAASIRTVVMASWLPR